MQRSLLFVAICFSVLCRVAPLFGQTRATQPAESGLIQLNLPDNVELKVLIDYVSQRLNTNFYFDEQSVNQKITLRAPAAISEDSLLPLLGSVLQSRGMVLMDSDQAGWKRIVPAANLLTAASTQPTTRPSGVITQVFSLTNVDPSKLEPLVRPFITQPGGAVISVPEQKLLLVTDFASNVQRIAELVRTLDRPRAAAVTKFLRVQHVEAAQVASQVSSLFAARAKNAIEPSALPPVEKGCFLS